MRVLQRQCKKEQAELYQSPATLPAGAVIVGLIVANWGKGACVRLASGDYVAMNAGSMRTLPQSEVRKCIQTSTQYLVSRS